MDPAELLRDDRLTVYSLGHYLGLTWNVEQKREANIQGLRLLEHCNVIPARNSVIDCTDVNCALPMRSMADQSRAIGWRFRCPANHKANPLNNTFLERARLNELGADTIVKLMFSWLTEKPLCIAMEESGVAADTATAWYQYCRDVARKVAWHNYLPIGGQHDIVEVDETHLFKSRYDVGRETMWQHHWVFGGISRTTKKRFAVLVDDRSADTLLPIMQDYIDNDSFICSDEWRSYRMCGQAFSGHGTVNHSVNFVNPPREEQPFWVPTGRFSEECLDAFDGPAPAPNLEPLRYHTQNIERAWRSLKNLLKHCKKIDHGEAYIGEWMYRENHLKQEQTMQAKFRRFCSDVARAYPGANRKKMIADIHICDCHECEQ